MKLDPGMHIGLHLVFFGKSGVTVGPTDRSVGLLVSRTYLSGMAVSLVGGDPGVPSLTSPRARCRRSDLREVMKKS
jgi:hypothetical protein